MLTYTKNSRCNEVTTVIYSVDICELALWALMILSHPMSHLLPSRLKIAFQFFECVDDCSASRMNTMVVIRLTHLMYDSVFDSLYFAEKFAKQVIHT